MVFWLKQIIFYLVIAAVVLGLLLLGAVWFVFREGQTFPDLTSTPVLPAGTLEVVVETDLPLGNAVVSRDGRIFFTVHPEAHHDGPRLYEWVNGAPQAYPDAATATTTFQTPLGLEIDDQDRLWVIDPGRHGLGQPRLARFDLTTNSADFTFDVPRSAAPYGSFLQDLAVSPEGDWVYIADAGFWNRRPAIVVVEVGVRRAHRMLGRHATTMAQNWLIRNQIRDMSYFGGILSMKTGVDGIALSPDGETLYFAPMSQSSVYQVPPTALHNPNVSTIETSLEVTETGRKPLSDGIEVDGQGNVYITDVEHQALFRINSYTGLETLLIDDRIRWADGLDLAPDGALYLTDSAVPLLVMQDPATQAAAAPFRIFRFTPPVTPVPRPLPSANTVGDDSG